MSPDLSSRPVWMVYEGEDDAWPFMRACIDNDGATIKQLLIQPEWRQRMSEEQDVIYDADPQPKDDDEATRRVMHRKTPNLNRAMTFSMRYNRVDAVSAMLQYATQTDIGFRSIIDLHSIEWILWCGFTGVVEAIVSIWPGFVDEELHHGIRPLRMVARTKQAPMASLLLRLGADPNSGSECKWPSPDRDGWYLADCASSQPQTIEILLNAGLTPSAEALCYAVAKHPIDCLKLLLRAPIDVNRGESRGKHWTPMHYAASLGNVEAMDVLTNHGGRTDIEDHDRTTPAQLWKERKAKQEDNKSIDTDGASAV